LATILETARLTLRELEEADLATVAEMLGDREVMHFFPGPLTVEESRRWIDHQRARYARDGHGYWLASLRESGEPVGQAGIIRVEIEGAAELALGYIVRRALWRHGFAAEAAAACRDHVFGALGTARAVTLIRPENLPSLGVARKIGMRVERRTIWERYEHLVLAVSRPRSE